MTGDISLILNGNLAGVKARAGTTLLDLLRPPPGARLRDLPLTLGRIAAALLKAD